LRTVITSYLAIILLCPTVAIARDGDNNKTGNNTKDRAISSEVRASLSEREEKLQKAKEDLARLEESLIAKQSVASSLKLNNVSNPAALNVTNSSAIIKNGEIEANKINNSDKKVVGQKEAKLTSSEISVQSPTVAETPQMNHSNVLEVAQLKERLVALESKQQRLTDELKKAHSDLLIAETEVERLSALLNQRNELVINRVDKKNRYKYNHTDNQNQVNNRGSFAEDKLFGANPRQSQFSKLNRPTSNDHTVAEQVDAPGEMPIATVIVTKAHLRTGPGKDHSPLLSVSEGTRLAVETREGEWYRVITPTGARAWVAGEVIKFGNKASIAAVKSPSIKPPSLDDADERAFQHLRSHTQSNVSPSE